jgi:RNA polymerase sigma-70 factor (ECF subfamily)
MRQGKLFWNFWPSSPEFVNRSSVKASKGRLEMTESDESLLARMLDGDEDALVTLYRRRQGAIYRFALHMTNSASAAEDITQEVFLALIENAGRFDAKRGKVLSFLYGIARNNAFHRIEKEWRITEVDPFDECAGDDDILSDLMRQETIDRVRRAVVALPPLYREAVVLCDLENLTYEEAAVVLGCPVGTVRSRLNRGRIILAEKFARLAGGARAR